MSPKEVLIIDSSQTRGLVAWARDGKIVAAEVGNVSVSHSEALLPIVDQVARASGAGGIQKVQGIAVGVGPGSFTGIRIGLATAKGLALALDLPVLGFSSLMALSYAADRDGHAVGVLNAYQGEIFAGWRDNNGTWCEEAITANALLDRLKGDRKALGEPTILCGTGAIAYRKDFLAGGMTEQQLIVEPQVTDFAVGAWRAIEAEVKFDQNAWALPDAVAANYLRSSQAEINASRSALIK